MKNLIDIGCGNGAFLVMMHNAAPGVKLSGLDISREMVAKSRQRLPGRISWREMLRKAGFDQIRSRLITPFTYVCVGRKPPA